VKVASGSGSLISRRFCIKLTKTAPPAAGEYQIGKGKDSQRASFAKLLRKKVGAASFSQLTSCRVKAVQEVVSSSFRACRGISLALLNDARMAHARFPGKLGMTFSFTLYSAKNTNKKATPTLEWLFSPFFCKKYLDTR